VNLPALGFGMGDVVLLEILKARQRLPKFQAGIDVFFLIEDEGLRHESLHAIQQLREGGVAVEYPLTLTKADKQFKRAQELGATNVGKLERAAAGELVFNLKDLKTKQQHTGPVGKVVDMLRAGRER